MHLHSPTLGCPLDGNQLPGPARDALGVPCLATFSWAVAKSRSLSWCVGHRGLVCVLGDFASLEPWGTAMSRSFGS